MIPIEDWFSHLFLDGVIDKPERRLILCECVWRSQLRVSPLTCNWIPVTHPHFQWHKDFSSFRENFSHQEAKYEPLGKAAEGTFNRRLQENVILKPERKLFVSQRSFLILKRFSQHLFPIKLIYKTIKINEEFLLDSSEYTF